MRKLLPLILMLALVLTACASPSGALEKKADTVFSRNGFSITLPAASEDKSMTETASEYPFLFSAGDIIITAMEVSKQTLGGLTLADFGQLLITSNGFEATLEQTGGYYTYTYSDEGDTVMSIVLETADRFWLVSASCSQTHFEKLQETMWEYLMTVQVSDT